MTDKPLFVEIADYAAAKGIQNIRALAGCWEVQIDAQWWMAVNGHTDPARCSRTEEPVPPFSAYLEYNGWPAGLIGIGEEVIAAGEAANAETFRAALRGAA